MSIRIDPIEHFAHIEIDRSASRVLDTRTQQRVDDEWHDLCAQNRRYFNGSILAFNCFDAEAGIVHAHFDQYKHHAVRDRVELDLSLLAVTAIVMIEGRVLLGKRSTQSHRYGGLWELGPSGGVDVPNDTDRIKYEAVLGEAVREIREEAGFEPQVIAHELVALVHDHLVGSSDLAVLLRIKGPRQIIVNWEYDDTRWVTIEELNVWAHQNPDELIPTTVALARFLHRSQG